MEKTLAIGDIHGEYQQLLNFLDKYDTEDIKQVVFVGDYIDRGPDSFAVVDHLIRLDMETPNRYHFLMGNHEEMFMDALANPESDNLCWVQQGGIQTLQSYITGLDCNVSEWHEHETWHIHRNFFNNLKRYHEDEKYIYVHGGLAEKLSLTDQNESDILWFRGVFIKSEYQWPKKVIFGHTPFEKPLRMANKLGIDTGCGKGKWGYLSGVSLPYEVFVK